MGRLEGRRAFLTAAGAGIGRATAEAFAREGAEVIATDVDRRALDGLAKAGVRQLEALDVCDTAAVNALAASVGEIDILFNCAGYVHHGSILECDEQDWDFSFDLNIKSMHRTIRAFLPGMLERAQTTGGGSIINLGSNSWWEAGGGFPAYTTAKAAVHGLTRTMARDLGDHRIRVNTVVPGWVMTERQKELWVTPESIEAHRARQCLPDLIDPVYVARMVVFLGSDDAAMCTANNYMVEAGSI